MLKTAPKSNPGWHGTFPKRCFFCVSDRRADFSLPPVRKKEDHARSRGMVFLFHNQILFKGGPQIETEKQTADTCPGRQKAQSQVLPCEGRLLCIPKFYDVPDGHAAGLCLGCMDEDHGDHEGRLQPDCAHLHRGYYCHRFSSPADDELLPLRPHGGRKPRMAEAHLHHLGDLKRPGVHHGLHHPVLCGWQVERLMPERSDHLWVF